MAKKQKDKANADLSNAHLVEPPLTFYLDPKNKVYLRSAGQFYLSRFTGMDEESGKEKWSEELKFSAPLNGFHMRRGLKDHSRE